MGMGDYLDHYGDIEEKVKMEEQASLAVNFVSLFNLACVCICTRKMGPSVECWGGLGLVSRYEKKEHYRRRWRAKTSGRGTTLIHAGRSFHICSQTLPTQGLGEYTIFPHAIRKG